MAHRNPTRIDFLERLNDLIERYNPAAWTWSVCSRN